MQSTVQFSYLSVLIILLSFTLSTIALEKPYTELTLKECPTVLYQTALPRCAESPCPEHVALRQLLRSHDLRLELQIPSQEIFSEEAMRTTLTFIESLSDGTSLPFTLSLSQQSEAQVVLHRLGDISC